MLETISPTAAQIMREAIRDAGGNEVFFLGLTDENRCVVDIETLARGSSGAVPAILQLCHFGNVVIHNHPSGNLTPSSADIGVASQLGSLGVGFYIVDNSVDQVYKVVEAFAPQDEQSISPEEIGSILGPDGVVAKQLPGYEERPEQLRMAFAVSEALNQGQLATIEAGTGTGKSLAYLVPAVLWAMANEERVVISTNTINLQEQLIRKDIPFLQRATGLEFRAVLVKGRSNYLCRRRLESASREPGLFDAEHSGELAAIIGWADQTGDGSREDLGFLPQDSIWEEVCCEMDQCARVRCNHYQECFFHKARRAAAQAELLVVNHALLLSDLSVRLQTDNYSASAVLPPFQRVIIDEAHHLEDVTTHYFSTLVTRFTFARVLNKLRHPRKPHRGLLPRLLAGLAKELPDSEDELYRALHEKIEALLLQRQQLLDLAVSELEIIGTDLAAFLGREVTNREELKQRVVGDFTTGSLWQAIHQRVKGLSEETARLTGKLRGLLEKCQDLPDKTATKLTSPITDLRGIGSRLEGIVASLDQFAAATEDSCVWLEVQKSRIGRGEGVVTRLCSAPLDIAAKLRQALYDRFRTVIMTSATLTVDHSFRYLHSRIGLNRCEPDRVRELQLDSPFDYARQTLVGVPIDIPEPGKPGFAEMVRDVSEKAILAADGRSFVLFTAYSLLRQVHAELSPVLQARGYACLRQGEDSRHRLLKKFTGDATSVLFATDSFWEGVDVPGRALEQVIICRLPFKVPTEPVLQARAEAIEKRGGDPFMEYTVPQAVIKFKQGFGRLIRHRGDHGVVLILDSRVWKKGYGRIFLRSLPEVRTVAAPTDQVMEAVRDFFQRERPDASLAAGE